ncbi:Cytochrome P450 CYP736A12 [Senna tora]|uniref:Cytochrome P450 CYP736A12 n=1 Tax=Senna tora TaxID=362788 RepID=A0A834WE17_9FABA|nr:Cytochrome P450 CYP736A12 [Senna tora]
MKKTVRWQSKQMLSSGYRQPKFLPHIQIFPNHPTRKLPIKAMHQLRHHKFHRRQRQRHSGALPPTRPERLGSPRLAWPHEALAMALRGVALGLSMTRGWRRSSERAHSMTVLDVSVVPMIMSRRRPLMLVLVGKARQKISRIKSAGKPQYLLKNTLQIKPIILTSSQYHLTRDLLYNLPHLLRHVHHLTRRRRLLHRRHHDPHLLLPQPTESLHLGRTQQMHRTQLPYVAPIRTVLRKSHALRPVRVLSRKHLGAVGENGVVRLEEQLGGFGGRHHHGWDAS